jgi:hypothetical protein
MCAGGTREAAVVVFLVEEIIVAAWIRAQRRIILVWGEV